MLCASEGARARLLAAGREQASSGDESPDDPHVCWPEEVLGAALRSTAMWRCGKRASGGTTAGAGVADRRGGGSAGASCDRAAGESSAVGMAGSSSCCGGKDDMRGTGPGGRGCGRPGTAAASWPPQVAERACAASTPASATLPPLCGVPQRWLCPDRHRSSAARRWRIRRDITARVASGICALASSSS